MITFGLLFAAMWLISAVLMAGWLTAELQEIWERYPEEQKKRFRNHLGDSLLICFAFGWAGPVAVFCAYLTTGFGSSGWQIIPRR